MLGHRTALTACSVEMFDSPKHAIFTDYKVDLTCNTSVGKTSYLRITLRMQ